MFNVAVRKLRVKSDRPSAQWRRHPPPSLFPPQSPIRAMLTLHDACGRQDLHLGSTLWRVRVRMMSSKQSSASNK